MNLYQELDNLHLGNLLKILVVDQRRFLKQKKNLLTAVEVQMREFQVVQNTILNMMTLMILTLKKTIEFVILNIVK